MPRKGSDVRERIEQYRQICETGDAGAITAATRKALGDRHYLAAARAAEYCGERMLYDLEQDLLRAYGRLLDNPVKKDPGCIAKGAIARALVALDCQESAFYISGIGYRQMEPVWGGTVDTAVDLRCTCAMGLVATSYPRALIELATLLHDPEPHARSGAARAIACTEPLGAEALLRSKALAGDPEPEVVGDCLAGVLRVEPEEGPAFVAGFLDGPQSELAALALGESRLDSALDLLRRHWDEQPLKRDADRVLLRAAVLHRSEAAMDWLLAVVARGDRTSAELVIAELGVYRANKKLHGRLADAVADRDDAHLLSRFEEIWGASRD